MKKVKKQNEYYGAWTGIHNDLLDSPAWLHLSSDARALYLILKRLSRKHRADVFLSQREASRLMNGRRIAAVRVCFAELEHYGFIRKKRTGSLGPNGRGIATTWRLTEKGDTSAASETGTFQPPTKNYLKWDGVIFEPPKAKPRSRSRLQGGVTGDRTPGVTAGSGKASRCDHRRLRKRAG